MVKKRWIKWLLRGKLLLIRGSREMKGCLFIGPFLYMKKHLYSILIPVELKNTVLLISNPSLSPILIPAHLKNTVLLPFVR